MTWISLNTHSQYSILDSTLSVKKIAQCAKEYNMSSIAITDGGNLFGAVDFYKACRSANIKAIIGCDIAVAPFSMKEKQRYSNLPTSFSIILLVKDKVGYQNLCKLSSIGYLEGFYYRPRIDKEELKKYKEGLICIAGNNRSSIGHYILSQEEDRFVEELKWYQDTFKDDFYLDFQRHKMSEEHIKIDGLNKESWLIQQHESFCEKQNKINNQLILYSKDFSIPCVATNDIHYLEREDWKAHEILLNIQSGETVDIWERDSKGNPIQCIPNPKRNTYPSHEFYFKSPDQMKELFSDIPHAIDTTQDVANKCSFEFDFRKKHYPVFNPKEIENTESLSKAERQKLVNQYLYDLCKSNLEIKYPENILQKVKKNYPDKDPSEVVKERLDYEFELISSKGLCDYILIVYDFIRWAKDKKIPVGPGRGSAAGSIISYLIGITDIEPLQFNLFFERFINPERMSYPDIDVDICMHRREEVIEYTIQKYGKDKVAQIITFGTMKAKMAIRDVGRVLNVSLSKVNTIAKLVPDELNITLEKALKIEPELKSIYEKDEEAKRIIDMGRKIEGSIRNTSTHAAGVVISASSITDHVPICTAKDANMVVTQYAMKPVESVGMLKIDFLGLKTLTSIQKAVNYVEQTEKKSIDWTSLPLDDPKTYNLLNQGKTHGIFQLESGGMKELSKQLHIDKFEEIIAVGALYRPGPMDMIPSFINRKHGRESIEIDHPWMKEILDETYGVMVYQEQVMQIASKLAGYSLGEGDVLRKAMGKKDKAEMEKQREKFLSGAIKKGIDEKVAVIIFDKIEKFASYGFNKSHATAYAYLSFTTAYLKANHTNAWMAALMTCDRDDLSKVAKHIQECQSIGIDILPPDVNESNLEFVPTKEGIRFAMSGIKGVGQGVVEAIVEERNKKGLYSSLYDFISRIDTSRVGKKNIEVLIDAGSFDSMGWARDEMKLSVEPMYEVASKEQKEKKKGVINLFSLIQEDEHQFSQPPKVIKKSSQLELLQKEKELLGFYLTSHPMKNFQNIIQRLSCIPLKEFYNIEHNAVCRSAFVIEGVKYKIASKSQRKFAILTISDGKDSFELPIWPELYEEKSYLLKDNQLLYSIIQVDKRENNFRLQCHFLDDLASVDETKIVKFDETYDQIKAISMRKKNNYNFEKKAQVNKTSHSSLIIDINADKIKFSKILQLKKIFKQYSGPTSVILRFFSNNNYIIGDIHLDQNMKIQKNDLLCEAIKSIKGVSGLQFK